MELLPHWELMQRYDPDQWAKLEPWRRHLFEEGSLPRKTKELLLVAMCTQARFLPGVRIHAGLAIDHGATPLELFELCALSLLIGGVPSYREAVLAIDEVVSARLEGGA